jgi:putative flippase GtrA
LRERILHTVRRVVPSAGIRQFGKYAIVGGANTAIDTLIYAALVLAGTGYVGAKAFAAAVATVVGYQLNRRWTFRVGRLRQPGFLKYCLVQSLGFVTNLAVLVLLVELAGLPALPAQLVALPTIAAVTFVGNKHWTFRTRASQAVAAAPRS